MTGASPLVVDANVLVAAYDRSDPFHAPSAAFLGRAADERVPLAAPALVVVETACAIARRTGRPELAREVRAHLAKGQTLDLLPLDADLLTAAEEIGIARRLRAADALYAAAAARLNCPLVSWDAELVARVGALTPDTWFPDRGGDFVAEAEAPEPRSRRSPKSRSARAR